MSQFSRAAVAVMFLGLVPAAAGAQVCVRIDESQDTLAPADRTAAVLLLTREFQMAGEAVAPDCPDPYRLAHIKLGDSITVTLSGPKGSREGVARGLDDLPALYDQMVRSLETGRPMGLAVVDRTNVTEAQTTARRVHSDGFTYARLGYGGIFAGRTYGVPSFGFGFRGELDRMAIDVSFLNVQVGSSDVYSASSAAGASFVKLSGLYLFDRRANSTPYVGGGLSWGRTDIEEPIAAPTRIGNGPNADYTYTTSASGSGLQGELTAGYEIGRATTIRMFVQADAILPFYSVTAQTYSSRSGIVSTSSRYTPSLVMSLGLGWQKNRK